MMSILTKIKMRLLPPSSRSFHACMCEIRDRLDAADERENNRQEFVSYSLNSSKIREEQLLNKINALNSRVDEQNRFIAELVSGNIELQSSVNKLANDNRIYAKHNELRFESLMRSLHPEDKTGLETRKRIFMALPSAEGDKLLMQKASAKLMSRLDEICGQLGIEYWFAYGTLIGTLSRSSSIP